MLHPWLSETKIFPEMRTSPPSQDLRQIHIETVDDSLVCKCYNGDKITHGNADSYGQPCHCQSSLCYGAVSSFEVAHSSI